MRFLWPAVDGTPAGREAGGGEADWDKQRCQEGTQLRKPGQVRWLWRCTESGDAT